MIDLVFYTNGQLGMTTAIETLKQLLTLCLFIQEAEVFLGSHMFLLGGLYCPLGLLHWSTGAFCKSAMLRGSDSLRA